MVKAAAALPATGGAIYKETEIGLIPSDWRVEPIESFALITTGGRNTQDRVDDGAYPFFVRSQQVERIDSYSFDGEAVLTAGDGVGTGKVFHYINGKCDIHQRVYRISDFRDDVSGYYFYLFFSTNFYNRIMQMTAKSSVDSVRREMIARMLIALPPKAEQEAIAEALLDADALIESLDALIAKKRAIKRGALENLLRPKPNWTESTLGDLCCFENGDRGVNYPSKSDFLLYGLPFVNAGHLEGGKIDQSDLDYISKEKFDKLGGGKFRHGDILFCLRGTLGKYALVNERAPTGAIASSLIIIRPIPTKLNVHFLYYYLQSYQCAKMIDLWAGGAAQPNLGGKDLRRFSIFLPSSIEEQIAIAAILSVLDTEIELLESKLAKAHQIKRGMMQELLTGRVRLA